MKTEKLLILLQLEKTAYNNLRKSDEAKLLAANFINLVITDKDLLPIPTKTNFDAAVEQEYGFRFLVIDRSIVLEKNGVRTSKKPFDTNKLVFLPSENVGRLIYGSLKLNKLNKIAFITVIMIV